MNPPTLRPIPLSKTRLHGALSPLKGALKYHTFLPMLSEIPCMMFSGWKRTEPLNPSTPQPLNPSTPQPLNPSTPQPLNPSTPQPLNPSTPQPLNPSTPPPLHSSTPQPSTPRLGEQTCEAALLQARERHRSERREPGRDPRRDAERRWEWSFFGGFPLIFSFSFFKGSQEETTILRGSPKKTHLSFNCPKLGVG